jgi:glutathione S-transferase
MRDRRALDPTMTEEDEMAIKLYYTPMTRAGRVRWMLEELGVPYELQRVNLRDGSSKKPEYLAVHPHGAVPALEDDGVVIVESAAIVLHLADRFPDKRLAPPLGTPQRARYYQWIVYTIATIEPITAVMRQQHALPEDQRDPGALAKAQESFDTCAGFISRALDGKKFLLGDDFSAADIMLGGSVAFARSFGALKAWPRLQEYTAAVLDRPARRRATAD